MTNVTYKKGLMKSAACSKRGRGEGKGRERGRLESVFPPSPGPILPTQLPVFVCVVNKCSC